MAKKANTRMTRKATTKKVPEATALRNALPFIRLGATVEGGGVNYWSVCPSGNYTKDLELGREYARAFLPLMAYNCGASDLVCIASSMALAARDLSSRPQGHSAVLRWRGIDNVAMGFVMEIGGILQALLGGAIVAASSIKQGEAERVAQFADAVERGEFFKGLQRSTLSHDPTATIFDKSQQH